MIHVYKEGGDWARDGVKFDVKVVTYKQLPRYLKEGYTKNLDEVLNKKKVEKQKKT